MPFGYDSKGKPDHCDIIMRTTERSAQYEIEEDRFFICEYDEVAIGRRNLLDFGFGITPTL